MKPEIKKCDLSREYYFDEGCYITELSNTSDDDDVSIAQARLETGKTTKWHSLSGTTERYVILQGVGRVEVGKLEPQQVGIGDVVIIPAEERQRITNIGEEDLIFLAVCSPRFEESNYIALE